MGSKKKKVKKRIGSTLEKGEKALVVCVGGDCCSRAASREVLDQARVFAHELAGMSEGTVRVRVVPFGCLGVCKNGPLVATLPRYKVKKHVDEVRVREILTKLFASTDA